MTERKSKTGRPIKPVDGEGQVTIGMRVPSALRAKLEQVAEKNHRTLSQEAERRLERSFRANTLLEDAIEASRGIGDSMIGDRETVDTVLRIVYGKPEIDIGMWVMEILSLVRRARGSRATVGVKRRDFELLRMVMKELEEGITVHE